MREGEPAPADLRLARRITPPHAARDHDPRRQVLFVQAAGMLEPRPKHR